MKKKCNRLTNTNHIMFFCALIFTFYIISCNAAPNENNNIEDAKTIVGKLGLIHVDGNKIVDKDGKPVALHGMSLFWSQWMGQYYTADCIKWLYNDWNCTVIRAAMGIEGGGFLDNTADEMTKIKNVIDVCIELGIYVIVDWHDHNAHLHQSEAISFFKQIATLYGDKPNIIYEIYNEPVNVSWKNDVKPYSEAVIQSIRAIDPDNLILVGSPTWSQDVDIASQDPINSNNIAYTLHFYSATHKQELRDKAALALNNGAALFVSEFGTCESNGSGIIDYQELDNWYKFISDNKLSSCNWSIADKDETSAALKPGTSNQGGWTNLNLTESGKIVRNKIKELNSLLFQEIGN